MTGKPSTDKPWLNHYSADEYEKALPKATVYECLRAKNADYPKGIALEYFGRKISYRELFINIDSVAKALKSAGVKKGDFVAISMPNTPEMVYLFYALNKIGAHANMVNPLFSTEQIASHLKNTGCKLAIVLNLLYDKVSGAIAQSNIEKTVIASPTASLPLLLKTLSALKKKPSIPRSSTIIAWEKFIADGRRYNGELFESYAKDTPAVMVYSSGSTGASKGIILTNESFNNLTLMHEVESIGIKRGQRILSIIPYFFSTGISPSLNMPLCLGVTVILEPKFSREAFVKQIRKSKPNHAIAATSLWEAILDDEKLKKSDLSFFRLIISGGEAMPDSLRLEINAFLKEHNSSAEIGMGWGMCEFGASVASTAMNCKENCGAGIPLSHITVSAFDVDTDEELSFNQRGELRVVTPCRMLGYYKNSEATDEFFRKGKDGQIWGCSGDVGFVNEEGNVFVVGRANDYIIGSDGNKIWLFDIENVMLTDGAVQTCEAAGLDIRGGQVPVAHLVLKQGCVETPETIIKRIHEVCQKSLPPDAVPRGYKLRDGFGVLPSGKRDTLSLKKERDGLLVPDDDGLREVSF